LYKHPFSEKFVKKKIPEKEIFEIEKEFFERCNLGETGKGKQRLKRDR